MILIIRSKILNFFQLATFSLNLKDQFTQHVYRGALTRAFIGHRISVRKSCGNTNLLQIVFTCNNPHKLLI